MNLMSPPALNMPPAPVRIRARISGLALTSATRAGKSFCIMGVVRALRALGLFMVKTATPSCTWNRASMKGMVFSSYKMYLAKSSFPARTYLPSCAKTSRPLYSLFPSSSGISVIMESVRFRTL